MLLQTKKACLRDHEAPTKAHFAECEQKAATPTSNMDVQHLLNWLQESKASCKIIEDDVKDAKRRVNQAKGPKKKKVVAPAEDALDGVSAGDASEDDP